MGYQTPFSAFKDGDYTKCVQKFFNVNIVNDDGSAVVPDETPAPAPAPSEDETPAPTPTPDETPAPVPDDIPAVVNHAPVAQIAGPIGAVEAGAQVSLSAEGSTDEDGNKLTYTWRSQDGQTVTGDDKAVVTFNAPEAATAQQYENQPDRQRWRAEQHHHIPAERKKPKQPPRLRTKALPALTRRGARTASTAQAIS